MLYRSPFLVLACAAAPVAGMTGARAFFNQTQYDQAKVATKLER